MKTLFKQPFQMLVATIVTTATLVACSNEMNPTDVPTGEPQAIAVRFATPSAGQAAAENPWQEGDKVTVKPQAQGDPSITFGYTKQEDGTYVWQNIIEGDDNYFKAILPASFTAYCPSTEGTSFNIFTLPNISGDGQTEQADQSDATKLRAADYMTAPITTVAQVGQALDLTLAHRLCRLTFVVTEYGNEFNGIKPTLEDVKIKSQHRTVNLTYEGDQVKVDATNNPVWVSPLIGTNAGGKPTYTAIITPCDLTSGTTELMSLTVNGTPLPVKYKGNLVALASGSAYTFHLKVGKDYVTVTGSDVTGWMGETTDVPSKEVKKYFIATDLKVGDYYYSNGETSDGGLRKLYTDGAFVMEEIPVLNNGFTVLGIVLKVGKDDSGDWKDDCNYMLKGTENQMPTIRGYVLALYDANNGGFDLWGSDGEIVGTNTEQDTGFYGYKNTNMIKVFATNNGYLLESDFPATYYATKGYEETSPAPDNTSGWFLPSAAQCQYWLNNKAVLLGSVRKATENDGYNWKDFYWSSSEGNDIPANFACRLNFYKDQMDYARKSDSSFVRSVLAF